MPRKRRNPKTRRAEVPSNVIALLDDSEPKNTVRFFLTDLELRVAWDRVRDEILAGWVEEQPGVRPFHWWKYEAPEPRRRLGGIGQAMHEVSAPVEAYEIGLPTIWVTPADVDRRGTAFEGVPIDAEDPPRFESEASYLERHGLFLPGEKDRLSKADFEFEVVMPYSDPDEADPEAA